MELDPLDELGQRRLIELLALAGDRTGAIRQYRELVALFDRELGVAPLRETTELYDAVREDRLDRGAPPAVSAVSLEAPERRRDRTVRSPSRSWDASSELDALRSAWRASDPDGRVVLLEGEAGIGKTRLAEVFAAGVREEAGIVLAARGYPGEGAIAYGPIAGTPPRRPRHARRTAPAGCAR